MVLFQLDRFSTLFDRVKISQYFTFTSLYSAPFRKSTTIIFQFDKHSSQKLKHLKKLYINTKDKIDTFSKSSLT